MHHTTTVASLFAPPAAAESATESPPGPAPPATADGFFSGLEAPITLENVRAEAEDGYLAISFDLREVGAVSVTVYWEIEGSGRAI